MSGVSLRKPLDKAKDFYRKISQTSPRENLLDSSSSQLKLPPPIARTSSAATIDGSTLNATYSFREAWQLSIIDVQRVRNMLRRIFLVDVVDNILLHAEYFAVLSRKGEKTVVEDDDHVRVLSFPMNKTLRESIRRVTVRIYGHDQGPSAYLQDQGSRDKSWTWYTLKSGQWEEEIARNSRTVLEPKAHVWTCKEGDSEMTHIRQGDEIEVWAHAKLFGWKNYVEGVEITIFFYPNDKKSPINSRENETARRR